MKRTLAVVFVLALLISTLSWLFTDVNAQGGPTLTIGSGPGGSVIVQSSAINKGQAVKVLSGQQRSWNVPYGASVTLKATDFALGLTFRGWTGPLNGKPFNPATITIGQYSTGITSRFEAAGYPNELGVTLYKPENSTYRQKNVAIRFSVANPNWAYFRLKFDFFRFYLDGAPYWVETSFLGVSSPDIYSFNSTFSALAEGEHSLFVVAAARFEPTRELPLTMPGVPSPASGVSEIVSFAVDTAPPTVSVLSPETKVYGLSDMPLSFVVNEPCSRLAYSLDGKPKVNIGGNVTFSLSAGAHNVTVYAWDDVGNAGSSQTITFVIAEEQEALFSIWIPAAFVALASAISFGLVAYFLRRKKRSGET